jgi:hypothetical protein
MMTGFMKGAGGSEAATGCKMDYFLTLAGLVFIFASSARFLSIMLYHQITRKEKTWLHH